MFFEYVKRLSESTNTFLWGKAIYQGWNANNKIINEYFDPDIDFGIKQYIADYQTVYLTFTIGMPLMSQSQKSQSRVLWKREIRNLLCGRLRTRRERSDGLCGSDSEWAVAHATRSSEGSQGCRENADDDL